MTDHDLDRLREEYDEYKRHASCSHSYATLPGFVKRADALLTQMQAERDEARSELEAIHALASSVPGMDPQDHETAMSVAEAMRAVIVQQAGDLERLRCWKED